MKSLTYFSVFTAFCALLVTSCATGRKPDYISSGTTATDRILRQDGLEVAIDPFVESERTREYFGMNAVGNGIAILHVRVSNQTTNQTFMIKKENFHLFLAGTTSGQTAGKKIDTGTAGGEATAMVGAALGSFGLVFVGASMISHDTEVRRNLVGKEMHDESLSPGHSVEGFIYYTPVRKHKDWSKGASIKIYLTDMRTQRISELNVQF